MQNFRKSIYMLSITFSVFQSFAQGPPILTDKPIMLGSKVWMIKSLFELRNTENGTYINLPIAANYLPTSNTLGGVYIPVVYYDFKGQNQSGYTVGDIQLLGKYQFYRKDKIGKTFRMVLKTVQTLPTGKSIGAEGISTGNYQSYFGVVAGYESIRYGISNELGYNIYDGDMDELRYKVGFGLPLLKPTYPVNQINLYFEYQNHWYIRQDEFLGLYAQGIQYAKGQMTLEAAIQVPLLQTIPENKQMIYSLFLGMRYAI